MRNHHRQLATKRGAQNSKTVLSSKFKELLHGWLVQMQLVNLHAGRITIEESKELSKFISVELSKVETKRDYDKFLFMLAEKWPKRILINGLRNNIP